MTTTTSTNGLRFLESEEGCILHPYLDSVKKPTIGYGSTYWEDGTPVKMTDKPITKARAVALFVNTLKRYEAQVNTSIKSKINQNQFDAMVSLCYNIGTNGFKDSTVVRRVNADPNDPNIREAFLMWRNAGGEPILLGRRKREAALYFTPVSGSKKTTTDVNLRKGPATMHAVISVLPAGTSVNVLSEANGWSQVFIPSNKLTGYVSSTYIK